MGILDKIKGVIKEKEQEEQTTESGSLKQQLQALGDKKEVNPPPEQLQSPPLLGHQITLTGNEGSPPVTVPVESPPEKADEGQVCPTCKKTFKRLGKHVCKEAKQSPKNEQPPETQTPPSQENGQIGLKKGEQLKMHATIHNYLLLIDCHLISPERGTVVDARDLCATAKEAVCEAKNIEHWKAVPYGEGPAQLELYFALWFEQNSFSGFIEIDSRSLEYQAIIQTLKKYATEIIKG